MADLKLTGFDFVPKEYFLGIMLIGDAFSITKSIKYEIKCFSMKYPV